MGQYITNAMLSLSELKAIVDNYKPFDTGYLFMFGNRYNETPVMQVVVYDILTVPYIQFLEEGTKFSTRHQGFISKNTVNAINSATQQSVVAASKNVQSKSSMISQGVLEHTKAYGREGGRYDIRSGLVNPTDKRTKEYFVGV